MIILYSPQDGEIFYVVKNSDISTFTHTTNIPLSATEISEDGDSLQNLRYDLIKTQSRKDVQKKGKYFIDVKTNPISLVQRDGWQPDEEGVE